MSAWRTLSFLAVIAGTSSSQTSDCSYFSLLNKLDLKPTNELLTLMRPVKNWTIPTLVHLDMVMYGILYVNEKSQTVTSHIWTQMCWENEFLTWNPSDFCGINMLTIPRSMLWIPDVTIQEDTSDTGSVDCSPLLSLYPTGLVLASAHQLLTSTCQFNLFLFPFDTQRCNITFLSFSYPAEAMKIGAGVSDTHLTSLSEQFMITHGEWQLKNMEISNYTLLKNNISRNKLTYMVTITRKPMLYVINFIVPLFYFLVLDLTSFLIGAASDGRLNFRVTLLLSISVLLLILQDALPSTEDRLPMIATYCIGIFALVGISVLEAMLVSFLLNMDGYSSEEAQSSVDSQVDIQLDGKDPDTAEDQGQVKPEKSHRPRSDWSSVVKLRTQVLQVLKEAQQEGGRHDKERTKPGRYRRLATIIDTVFFVLYFFTVVIFMVSSYMVWMQNYFTDEKMDV